MNYKKIFLKEVNKIWKKNYSDLNFMEIFINLPRLSKKNLKDMTDDEILKYMEILSQKIKKKSDLLKSSDKLIKTIEKKWEDDISFGTFIESLWEKYDSDLSISDDLSLIKILNKKDKENEDWKIN